MSVVADMSGGDVQTVLKKGESLLDNISAVETSVNDWQFRYSVPTVRACAVSAADVKEFDATFGALRLEEQTMTSSEPQKVTEKAPVSQVRLSNKNVQNVGTILQS